MKYIFILLSFFSVHSFAINLEVTPSQSYDISQIDIENTVKLWQGRNLRIDAKEAKKLILENRVLADAFLKQGYFSDSVASENKIVYEEKLADLLVKNELKKIDNVDIPLSYYEDNKHEFYLKEDVHFKVYAYKTFEEALACYDANKNKIDQLERYAKETNASVEEHTISLKTLHPQLQNLLIDFTSGSYITPPQKFYTNYIVFEVVEIIKAHLQPFKEVEEKIRKKLKKRIMNEKRTELVKKYFQEKSK